MNLVPFERLKKHFWAKVGKGKAHECWLWKGTKSRAKNPYGSICIATDAKTKKCRFTVAHRVSWRIHRGPIPEGLKVLHKCDVPLCVNPAHLFLGTQLDNMRDCASKGRNWVARGTLHKKSKLTEADVRWIRASKLSGRKTAKKFKVSFGLISRVRARRVWKHI